MYEFQQFALHESIVIVLHFDGTSIDSNHHGLTNCSLSKRVSHHVECKFNLHVSILTKTIGLYSYDKICANSAMKCHTL